MAGEIKKKHLADSLKNEINSIGTIAQQLGHVEDEMNTAVKSINDAQGTLLCIDDDLSSNAYSVLFEDVVKGRGIPFTFAAISNRILTNDSGTVTLAQFREMKNHPLVTMVNHTNSHPYLATLTEAQIEDEIKRCRDFLVSEGVTTRSLVPPFGSVDARVRKIAMKYVDSIFVTNTANGTVNCSNGDFLNTQNIRRIDFSQTIDVLKQHADVALATNGLLVLSTHARYSSDEQNNPTQNFVLSKLHTFLDYCELIGLDIADFKTAMNRFKNAFELREADNVLKVGISAQGKTTGLSTDFLHATERVHMNDLPQTHYPLNTTTKQVYRETDLATYGYPKAGILFTHTGNNYAFVVQELHVYRSNEVLTRYFNHTTSAWSDLVTTAQMVRYIQSRVNIVDAPDTTKFPFNTETRTYYNASSAAEFGYPDACIVAIKVGSNISTVTRTIEIIRTGEVLRQVWNDQTSVWTKLKTVVPIRRTLEFSTSQTYADIAHGGCARRTITGSHFKKGDVVEFWASDDSTPIIGAFLKATIVNDGQCLVDIYNMSGAVFNPSGSKWIYEIRK